MLAQDSSDFDAWIEYSLRVVVDGEAVFNEIGVSRPNKVWLIAERMLLLNCEAGAEVELDIFRRYWTPKRKAG